MGVVFDLDQTIVDSKIATEARKFNNWSEVNRLIPEIKPYQKIVHLINLLSSEGIEVVVVTSSPSFYCDKILSNCGISNVKRVCFHDTIKHKPDPEPLQKAVSMMEKQTNKKIIAIGDSEEDVVAAKRAGYFAILVGWSNRYTFSNISIEPDLYCKNEDALLRYFMLEGLKVDIFPFKCRTDNIFSMYEYYPKSKKTDALSKRLFNTVKGFNHDLEIFEKFREHLPEILLKGKTYGIFIVPSSGQNQWNEQLINNVALPLIKQYGILNCTKYLRRHKNHEKSAYGGERSIASHCLTINLERELPIEMDGAVIIDDITTTGNIFRACKQKIIEKGIPDELVICVAVGGTEYIN